MWNIALTFISFSRCLHSCLVCVLSHTWMTSHWDGLTLKWIVWFGFDATFELTCLIDLRHMICHSTEHLPWKKQKVFYVFKARFSTYLSKISVLCVHLSCITMINMYHKWQKPLIFCILMTLKSIEFRMCKQWNPVSVSFFSNIVLIVNMISRMLDTS